jgi:hypothetical protein
MVQSEAVERIYHHEIQPLLGSPVGQIVGRMNEVQTTAEFMDGMVSEYQAVVSRLAGLSGL